MDNPLVRLLHEFCSSGNTSEVVSLLRDHPNLNVNWTNEITWSALHYASFHGHSDIVKLLLAHTPASVNPNIKGWNGQTAFSLACQTGHLETAGLLLGDPRVEITLEDGLGCTPLWYASANGKTKVMKWLMASGRDLGDLNQTGNYHGVQYTALEIAQERKKFRLTALLERFMANSAQTRHEIRAELGFPDELAAEVFALIVFLCDELLHLTPAHTLTNPGATRFFTIASKLPMELQMVLCHRGVGSMKQNIVSKDSEAAFKALTRTLLQIE